MQIPFERFIFIFYGFNHKHIHTKKENLNVYTLAFSCIYNSCGVHIRANAFYAYGIPIPLNHFHVCTQQKQI